MTTLLEDPLPIYALGAVLATLAGAALLARRNLASLVVLLSVIAVTMILLLVEKWIVTEREKVEIALTNVMDAVEENDPQAVATYIDPAAQTIRDQAAALMELVDVRQAGFSGLEIEIRQLQATSRFRGVLNGTQRGGAPIGFFDDVDIHWSKRGDHWVITDYTAYNQGKPIDALGSARSRRPVPAR